MRRALSLVVVVLSFGCASTEQPSSTSTPSAHDGHGHGAEAHKESNDPAVAAFHDVLSPLWHAAPGADRTQNTCSAAAQMSQLAAAMTTSTPATAQADYAAKAAALVAATAELEKVCATPERAAFDATFHALHEAFHGVAAAAG